MKGKGIVGGVIVVIGVVLILLGIYRVVTSDFVASNISSIVGKRQHGERRKNDDRDDGGRLQTRAHAFDFRFYSCYEVHAKSPRPPAGRLQTAARRFETADGFAVDVNSGPLFFAAMGRPRYADGASRTRLAR